MYSENSKPYLSQIGTKKMEGNMQVSYSAKISKQKQYQEMMEKKQKEEMLQEIKDKKELAKEDAKKQSPAIDVQEQIQNYQEQHAEKTPRKPAFKRLKSFKEMGIIEKLEYLLHFPKQLPPVPCIVMTANENIRGFVVDLTEENVEIKLMDQLIVTIRISAIQEVRMIGI
ncbi:CotO family spore coat protein [Niallia sp.]|uniref:CotO family spore coat protein n=1 Tax=Niallia sp. TaxID=2837523 RepID=UPI00289B7434|nr:CotO family spore coat protein [Niallia sp.]